jgi:2-aminomuconate deaminase
LVFISGAIPDRTDDGLFAGSSVGPDGELLHDVAEQLRSAIQGIEVVLGELGCDLESIVDVTVFLRDIKRDFAAFNHAYGEIFDSWMPTRTTIEVSDLPSAVCVEVKIVAYRP